MFRFIIVILISTLCFGCVSTSLKSGSILKFKSNEFEGKATNIIEVSKNASAVAVNLYELPQTVQLNIPQDGREELIGIRLVEENSIMINRHLLFNREYGVDDNGVVKIQLQAPYIYFLDGKIRYKLVLLYYDRTRHATKRKNLFVSLNWRPMKAQDGTEYSFDYYDLEQLKTGGGIDLPVFAEEKNRANIERFAPEYQDKIWAISQ
ncbi:MAG: hypothetical protein C0615_01275 [Desulfuromonas sp.]|nr:MAG: hypothetical protein C0615_01275 [Desulfuromonas sp.]